MVHLATNELILIRELTQHMVVFRGVNFAMRLVHAIQWVDRDGVVDS